MTPNVWMFIKTYENLRRFVIDEKAIITLIQMAKGAFFKEATVDICAFVLKNASETEKGLYFRLEDFKGGMEVQRQKVLEAIDNKYCGYFYESDQSNFSKIPGSPIAYWMSENIVKLFKNECIKDKYNVRQGMTTSDNIRFLRLWFEVNINKVGFGFKNSTVAALSNFKWFPYNKGGAFRKWYGNDEYIVNYYKNGKEMTDFHALLNQTSSGGRIKNKEYYFQNCITWSKISSGSLSLRYKPYGFIFDVAGSSIFAKTDNELEYILSLYNSKIGFYVIGQLSPTLNFEAEQIKQMPLIENNRENNVENLTKECINISKNDWDSFETSWNFKKNPLL